MSGMDKYHMKEKSKECDYIFMPDISPMVQINGSMQKRRKSSVSAMELHLFCIKPAISIAISWETGTFSIFPCNFNELNKF